MAGEFFVWFVFIGVGEVHVSGFACNATGLDAVQRLEQKKPSSSDTQDVR